jgi:hypothetical protein
LEPLNPSAERDLRRIIKYARKRGIRLLLYKAPSSDLNKKKTINYIREFAKKNDVPFIDFNENLKAYHHLSFPKAAAMTAMLGKYLAGHYSFPDKRTDPKYADWNKSIDFYKQQELKYYLNNNNDFADVLRKLNNPNYVVIVAARDSTVRKDGEIRRDIIDAWKNLGLDAGILDKSHYHFSYIALVDGGKKIYESREKEADHKISWKNYIPGLGRVLVESKGGCCDIGEIAKIKIDNANRSLNRRGFNILVYDKIMDDIIRIFHFDTFDIGYDKK